MTWYLFPGDVTDYSNANRKLKRHTNWGFPLRGFPIPAVIPCDPLSSTCQFALPWIPHPLTAKALQADITPNGKIMAINPAEEKI